MTQTQNRDREYSCVLIHILKLKREEKEGKEAKWAVVASRGSGVLSLHKITKDYRLLWGTGCSGDGRLIEGPGCFGDSWYDKPLFPSVEPDLLKVYSQIGLSF